MKCDSVFSSSWDSSLKEDYLNICGLGPHVTQILGQMHRSHLVSPSCPVSLDYVTLIPTPKFLNLSWYLLTPKNIIYTCVLIYVYVYRVHISIHIFICLKF